MTRVDPQALTAAIIREQLLTAPPRDLAAWRQARRKWSRTLRSQPGARVVEIATLVMSAGPWGRLTAYELIASHPTAAKALTSTAVLALARGLRTGGRLMRLPVTSPARLGARDTWRHERFIAGFVRQTGGVGEPR